MKASAIFMLPFIAFAASCGGSGGSASDATPPTTGEQSQARGLPSDDDIIAKVYDPSYSVPTDFFVDERAGTAQSYTVHHVMDSSISYELCSDDFSIAQEWEATDNDARSVNGYYVGAYENDRYFEFIRELSYGEDIGNIGDLTSPGFSRVFKCSNTDRNGVDRSLLTGYAGKLNARPLLQQNVRHFAEYFWQFTFFPQRHKKVLDSYAAVSENGPGQTLLLAFATSQGTGRCDLIEVVEWHFVADGDSGEVRSRFAPVKQFEAELANGSPQLCL